MARILDAISSHRTVRLSCVEAGELLGFSERHFRSSRVASITPGFGLTLMMRKGGAGSHINAVFSFSWSPETPSGF
jgi:hypothetical protein